MLQMRPQRAPGHWVTSKYLVGDSLVNSLVLIRWTPSTPRLASYPSSRGCRLRMDLHACYATGPVRVLEAPASQRVTGRSTVHELIG